MDDFIRREMDLDIVIRRRRAKRCTETKTATDQILNGA